MSSSISATPNRGRVLYNVDPYEEKNEKNVLYHEREVEVFQATNFLMAIFTGDEAQNIINNAAIERRLAYYIVEVFAAVDFHRGSLRYAPIRVSRRPSSVNIHNDVINSPYKTVSSNSSVNESDSISQTPSKRSVYPAHPLEVRKFLFLQQVSLFPWHFPLSRITLPTHIGMQLLGETSKGDTIQLFCLLSIRDVSLFINALSVAFPTQFQDYLHFSHLKEPISSHILPLPLKDPIEKKANPWKRLITRHSQCIVPLWQRECVKVSFFSLRTSSWTNWQWCTLQIRDHYVSPIPSDNRRPSLSCSKLIIQVPVLPQNSDKNNSNNQNKNKGKEGETVRDRTDSFTYFDPNEATVFAGDTITYYLHDVTISLAEIATQKRRNSYPDAQTHSNLNNNSINRRLFPEHDEDETAEEDTSVVIRVKCQQSKSAKSPLARFTSSNDKEVSEDDLEDIQIHIELPTQEILLEFSLALASTCNKRNAKLSNSFNSFNYHYNESDDVSQPLHFAKEYLEKLQKDATQHTKYRIERQPFLDSETPFHDSNNYLNNTEKQWRLFEKMKEKAMVEVETAFHDEYIAKDVVFGDDRRRHSFDNSTTL